MLKKSRLIFNWIMVFTTIAIMIYIFILYRKGILTDATNMHNYIFAFGIWAPLVFVLMQIISVIFPVIPNAITTILGVVFFGPIKGFIYNYLSIVIGSILAFFISRHYGVSLVKFLIGEKVYNRYVNWLSKRNKFKLIFTVAIFLPIAPDDILCFLAGLTKMSSFYFIIIIFIGKPLSILIYSLGGYQLLMDFFSKL